jgi:hypothetical protein
MQATEAKAATTVMKERRKKTRTTAKNSCRLHA